MDLAFLLNGRVTRQSNVDPTQTFLDWLREEQGHTGTKEGCNEGDCGACTVVEVLPDRLLSLNACILFMGQLQGRALRTVEGVGPQHPVQDAMVKCHGSQCGFCTPGFVMSLVAGHANGAQDHQAEIAGNLCRCTGYAPILRAAKASCDAPLPDWIASDRAALAELPDTRISIDSFAQWYRDNPDTTLVAGATDVGLWVTKQMRDLGQVFFLRQIDGFDRIDDTGNHLRIGAGASVSDASAAIVARYPGLEELFLRFASTQIRNAGTLGGNIANGSPIGDGNPAMIALNAQLVLQHGPQIRRVAAEDFFVAYGQQDMARGEFLRAIEIPHHPPRVRGYKVSKRFEQDISAVCGCFSIDLEQGRVSAARLAFGGLAATPKRARTAEAQLQGQPWSRETVEQAMAALAQDFAPISDMRASAEYRMLTAQNLLLRYFLEDQGPSLSLFGGAA